MRAVAIFVALFGLAACQSSGGLPTDPSPQAGLGDDIAEPTDGFENELGPDNE
ncbi:hypothetical protein [Palleronia abyssalis]|uniref:Lipoprotein n=1 Tax=Palleronia abyssalis TaxID=1501240 RepID=A0A2R8BVX4_9RHOB|nr:hypothetical protein [Palleronia abyssalis]SPJ24309.1 hypothetical protein PAA8504_02137 [Palleronia abyssalis]